MVTKLDPSIILLQWYNINLYDIYFHNIKQIKEVEAYVAASSDRDRD